MNRIRRTTPENPRVSTTRLCALAAVCVAPALLAQPGFPAQYEWDIELLSMDLNATALMPLGPGWDPILTDIHIGESAVLDSKGKAFAFKGAPNEATAPGTSTAPPQLGEPFFVQSFFDVFFDITLTDVDPVMNFGGGPTDGLSLTFPNNGPAHLQNFYSVLADPNLPNFGLLPPPEVAPSIGWFNVEIPLGTDLNGNGENDKIKITLFAHTALDANRTFIVLPDGTTIDSFDSVGDLSGDVVDELQDPPFGPITLTGPTTASSRLVIPEPRDYALLSGAGLLGLVIWRRCRS